MSSMTKPMAIFFYWILLLLLLLNLWILKTINSTKGENQQPTKYKFKTNRMREIFYISIFSFREDHNLETKTRQYKTLWAYLLPYIEKKKTNAAHISGANERMLNLITEREIRQRTRTNTDLLPKNPLI